MIPLANYVTAALKFGKDEITDSVPRMFFRPSLFSSIHLTGAAVEPYQRTPLCYRQSLGPNNSQFHTIFTFIIIRTLNFQSMSSLKEF